MTKDQLNKANQVQYDIQGWQQIVEYLKSNPIDAHDKLSGINFRFNIPEDDSIVIELEKDLSTAFANAADKAQSRLDMLKQEFDSL